MLVLVCIYFVLPEHVCMVSRSSMTYTKFLVNINLINFANNNAFTKVQSL